MDPQPSTWIDQKISEIMDDLGIPKDWDEPMIWAYVRYAYGLGYIEGVKDRPTP